MVDTGLWPTTNQKVARSSRAGCIAREMAALSGSHLLFDGCFVEKADYDAAHVFERLE